MCFTEHWPVFGKKQECPPSKKLPFDGHLGKKPGESSSVVQSVVLGLPVLGKMGLLLEMPPCFPEHYKKPDHGYGPVFWIPLPLHPLADDL